MLPNYAPWYGLEVFQMGVSMTDVFFLKMGNYGRSRPYIYHWSNFFWVTMSCGGVLRSVNGTLFSMTHFDITMGNDVARDAHCNITMGNDVARDAHCNIAMSNDVARDAHCNIAMDNDVARDAHCNIAMSNVARDCITYGSNLYDSWPLPESKRM